VLTTSKSSIVYCRIKIELSCLKFILSDQGRLKDGTIVAIKVLSADSRQGFREFINELAAISDIVHENLITLVGCCAEGSHRFLVYNYLENNSLACTLLGMIFYLNVFRLPIHPFNSYVTFALTAHMVLQDQAVATSDSIGKLVLKLR